MLVGRRLLFALASTTPGLTASNDVTQLKAGLDSIDDLLNNWNERTLNCRYAEVNKELLGTKKELLEEASKNALMSKNAKTVCKRDPEFVRIIFGLDTVKKKNSVPAMFREVDLEMPTSTLVGADRLIRRNLGAVDDIDAYVAAEEAWLEAMAALDTSSYASGAADFAAIVGGDSSAFLDDTRKATLAARDALRTIVSLLAGSP